MVLFEQFDFLVRGHRSLIPRRIRRQGLPTTTLDKEGAGNAGCSAAPAASRAKRRSTRAKSPQVGRNDPAFPARWFTVFFALSSVSRAFLPPSSARCASIVAYLASASGCRDHTSIFWYSVKHAETKKTL